VSKLLKKPVEYRIGDCVFEGLFVVDAGRSSPRPGIVIAHTIRGRSAFEEGKAEILAQSGYAAMAIDVYGKTAIGSSIDECRALMEALKADRAALQERLLAALQALREQPQVDTARLAAIGYCFGGLCALDIARTGADIAGVISFHGLLDAPENIAGKPIAARILVLHGWDDPLAPPEQVLNLARELGEAGADWQLHAYGNVRHAFTNPAADPASGVTVYNAAADRRSWLAAGNFLSELFDH